MTLNSGVWWDIFTWLKSTHFGNGKQEEFGRTYKHSAEWYNDSGEWMKKHQDSCSKPLETPHEALFRRMPI